MPTIDFEIPMALALLPLALLPLMRRRRDVLLYACTSWLPDDQIGRLLQWLWRILAVLVMLLIVLGLARPGQSETFIERIGRGAEISILMDRSSSMDGDLRRNTRKLGEPAQPTRSKNDAVRTALTWLLQQRPENRYSYTMFNVAPIRVTPFTDDVALVRAGLDASAIGRGPNKTNLGLGLLAAIEAFDGRPYSGSRAILLVSDGGAKLSEEMRRRITQGLERNRIGLYFIFIQSNVNTTNLELVGTNPDLSIEQVALHVFFDSIDIEYRVFHAEDPASMAAAVRQIDQLENLPLLYRQRVPRIDYSHICFIAAFVMALVLTGLSFNRLERWQ